MSCWVVPALAAEIWGIPLQQVLNAVRLGEIPTKTAIGLTFVDVAPDGPTVRTGYRLPTARPNTFTPAVLADELSESEVAALSPNASDEPSAAPEASQDEEREEEILSTVDEYEEGKLDWRHARRSASRLRRAPKRLAA